MRLTKVLFSRVVFNLTIILLSSGVSSQSGISQSAVHLNLREIPQKDLRKYIISRSIDQMVDFSSIHPSWGKNIDESDFKVMEKSFDLKYSLSEVWECYRHSNPFRMWNGKSVRFGLVITKCSNSVIYANSRYFPEIDTGQVYFLSIRVMKGLFNIPVAFEIINIKQEEKIMEISYIESNTSRGKQSIQFFDRGDGSTRIVHTSYFRSDSRLRDDLLYPGFHNKFIKEFHRNMKHLIQDRERTLPL